VTVSDGTTTKTHTVTNLFVDAIDVTADTVSGRADPGTDVDIWVHGDGNLTTIADGAGNWTADFSGMTDLTYLSDGGSAQYDADGDGTGVWWAAPRIQVAPDDDWVQSWNPWTPGATISLTIEDGSGVIYSDSQTADSNGNFHFALGGIFDLQRGHLVTVSDGTTTKTHTVMDLFVDGVDVTGDSVFGRAAAGTDVNVWVHGDGSVTATADGAGNWIAGFSAMTDLTYASDGGSQQFDDDGDATGVWWSSPHFQANPDFNWVGSSSPWTAGATISLTIEDGSGVVYSDSQTADTDGDFFFGLGGIFDLQRGHVVTVSDSTITKAHTVIDLHAETVDVSGDRVLGTTSAGTEVSVWVYGANAHLTATPDGAGNWTADFSGMHDLTYFSEGGAVQADDDGDSTAVEWSTPRFLANPDYDWVQSMSSWTPGATISLTIEDGSGVAYADSENAGPDGHFSFDDLGGFDLVAGHVITISDGLSTKTHTVTDVTVTIIDDDLDEVFGTANPGAWVSVEAYLLTDWSQRWVVADGSGNWTADFSVAWEDQTVFDITEGTFINAQEYDSDADATVRRFGAPVQANRGVAVTPIDNHVWVANSGVNTVTRLNNTGEILAVIDVGIEPTGVAVDAAGKVWVTNLGSDNAMRIDPATEAVDLTVDLGPEASPYNYSDMTGAVVVGSTSPQGFWTVVQDAGQSGFEWGRITWNTEPEGDEPPGTEIVVEARTADTEAGLGGQAFLPVMNGDSFSSSGRYIEVRVTLKASPGGISPVLSDIAVQPYLVEVDIDIKPGSYPNSINVKKTTGVVPVAVLGSADFDVTRIDVTRLRFGPAEAMPGHDLTDPFTYADHLQDVNEDGFVDLVSHYLVGDTGLAKGDTEACISGQTLTGIPITGCDSVRIIGK
jgi:hypothetical protein